MEPFIWDSQRTSFIERLYIHQIVVRYVTKQQEFLDEHVDKSQLIKTITNVLTAAQAYMRKCSFVSLHDVERAMMVMTWFYRLCGKILDELMQDRNEGGGSLSSRQTVRIIICWEAVTKMTCFSLLRICWIFKFSMDFLSFMWQLATLL